MKTPIIQKKANYFVFSMFWHQAILLESLNYVRVSTFSKWLLLLVNQLKPVSKLKYSTDKIALSKYLLTIIVVESFDFDTGFTLTAVCCVQQPTELLTVFFKLTSVFLHKSTNLMPVWKLRLTKGQLISKCPFGVIVWTKIPMKKIDKFSPRI